jgi:hypothetical protein
MKKNISFMSKFWIVIPILLLFFILNKHIIIILSILIPAILMIHKRFVGLVLGIDVCIVFGILSSNKFGPKIGAIVGGVSFLIGMIISLEISKSPITTFYGTAFYMLMGILGAIIPVSILFNQTILLLLIVNVLFFIGLKFLGAPFEFLVRYTFSNLLTNLIFIRIFEPLLKLMF